MLCNDIVTGNRSLVKDLEAQVALVTSNPSLGESLLKVSVITQYTSDHYYLQEREHLFSYATQLQSKETLSDPHRKLLLWEWIATNVLKQHV